MHCENTTFAYNNEFNEYVNVEGAASGDVFYYLFNIGAGKFLSKNERNIFLNYLRNGIQSIFNMMKILMIILTMMV